MKYYIFLILTGRFLHAGYTRDIKKTMAFYKELPNLFLKSDFNKLVYLEEVKGEETAILRFKEITSFPQEVKEILIETVNPNYIELVPDKNINLEWLN